MDDLTRDTLEELCQGRTTRSAVTLAADLVERGRLSTRGDPVGLLTTVIEDLSRQGLVIYKLRNGWASIPLEIRVTPAGFAKAGYARITPAVGSISAKGRAAAIRPGEPMEWRLLHASTWGGPIERMPLAEHLVLYPDHRSIHIRGDDDMASAETNERRKRERGEKVVQALAMLGGEATFTEFREHLGTAQSWTAHLLDEAASMGLIERVGEANAKGSFWRLLGSDPENGAMGTRDAILKILRERGEVADDKELINLLGLRQLGTHSLDHQLYSMEKRGLITFKAKRAGNLTSITRIRLDKSWPPPAKTVDFHPMEEDAVETIPVAEGQVTAFDPATVALDQALISPGALVGSYPALESLRQRDRDAVETRRRADAFQAAASVLDGVDQAESERLFASANALAQSVKFTPLEAEYLRFAEDAKRYVEEVR